MSLEFHARLSSFQDFTSSARVPDCPAFLHVPAHHALLSPRRLPHILGLHHVAMCIVFLCCTLLQFLDSHTADKPTVDGEVVRLYGGLGKSMFTLYLSISGGVDWHELLDPLLAFSGWFRIFFILFVSFMHFGMLNILSAIFVSFVATFVDEHHQEEVRDRCEADSAVIEELRQILSRENSRQDGRITLRRLQQILKIQCTKHLNALGLDLSSKSAILFLFVF